MKKIYNEKDWVNKTKKILKKFSDRDIVIHNKIQKITLEELLQNAWAFISLQSTAGFKAMLNGVPAYFT